MEFTETLKGEFGRRNELSSQQVVGQPSNQKVVHGDKELAMLSQLAENYPPAFIFPKQGLQTWSTTDMEHYRRGAGRVPELFPQLPGRSQAPSGCPETDTEKDVLLPGADGPWAQ